MNRFTKGFKLPDHKYRSLSHFKIAVSPAPRFVTLALTEGLKPCVEKGDSVLVGTKIAEAQNEKNVPLHSSVSGHVQQITPDFVRIESDESDRLEPSIRPNEQIPADPKEIIRLVREAGVVHLDDRAFPIHNELETFLAQPLDLLLINGCESEPFITANHLLMLNHPNEILKGTELLRSVTGAKRAIIAVEENKREVRELLNSKNYTQKLTAIETVLLPTRYPQGSPKTLVSVFQNKQTARLWVVDAATAFAVYEAVYLKKPLYERVVTISGPCVIEPKNAWFRIGTSAGDLLRSAKGLMREPKRILFGNPMTGVAITSIDTPISKKTSGVIALPSEMIPQAREETCIRCGLCADFCPESLSPESIVKAVRSEAFDIAEELEMNECTECGLCSYVCPSHIPLAQVIKEAKRTLTPLESSPETVHVVTHEAKA